jgi:hypothetical protein
MADPHGSIDPRATHLGTEQTRDQGPPSQAAGGPTLEEYLAQRLSAFFKAATDQGLPNEVGTALCTTYVTLLFDQVRHRLGEPIYPGIPSTPFAAEFLAPPTMPVGYRGLNDLVEVFEGGVR